MKDWQMDSKKVLHRTSSLLQNKSFTDVTFIVGPTTASKKYVGHKVLLAMTSPVFESMFYGDMADKAKVIRVADIAPIGFENLLRYAYTDALNLETVEDAMLTATAAKKYLLPHLLRECFNYIEKNVSHTTVCQVLEFALNLEAHHLVFQCLNIIDRQSYHVLTSSNFPQISLTILETIVQRKHLNIHTEITLYNALFQWAQEEAKRRNIEPTIDNLRTVMDTTLPYIRFLAMTAEDFTKGPAKAGLLSKEECFHIFMNLAVPGITSVPRGICSATSRRTSPPEFYVCTRFKPVSFHTPIRPLRVFGVRFTVTNMDVFVVGLGISIRLDVGYYSAKKPSYDGLLRCTCKFPDERLAREELKVNFVLAKDKDVKIKFRKPLFARKGVEYEIDLQTRSAVAQDIVAPNNRSRKHEETAEGATFQFSAFKRGLQNQMSEVMEFSEILFYY
ncbi:BTB/POZ domain-containing protein 6-like [Limulus polyphemus]|uniref:BTB/POZ domain-containing protein 6-like n=1 Tax=Limulus polyphemus TaxID=6850 RepID=A0ABM1BED5_LIMPO|nr:BTB/POZ domain-containing protein 6-like [Limulus polyphemus]